MSFNSTAHPRWPGCSEVTGHHLVQIIIRGARPAGCFSFGQNLQTAY
jgi:hypothetical protein